MWHSKSDQWGWGRLRLWGWCVWASAQWILGWRYIDTLFTTNPQRILSNESPLNRATRKQFRKGSTFLVRHWILLLHSPSSTCLKARIGSQIPWFMCKWSTSSVPRQETHYSQLANHGEPQKNVFIRVESAVNPLISTKMCGNHWDESVLDTV
jgi:hypothetical protein